MKKTHLFDKFSLAIPSALKVHQDGPIGKRCIFITDKAESFCISFQEDMAMTDMLPQTMNGRPTVSFQCCKSGKYIHLRRCCDDARSAFFHIELDDGKQLTLPGQMTVSKDYSWCDGMEPVLMEILENISAMEVE